MADFEYFRAEESDQFSFFRIPKALFTEKEFASLSTDAKLLYGILLDRISLSKKNGWIDNDGYVYIIYTIAELQELLRMSHTTVTNPVEKSIRIILQQSVFGQNEMEPGQEWINMSFRKEKACDGKQSNSRLSG